MLAGFVPSTYVMGGLWPSSFILSAPWERFGRVPVLLHVVPLLDCSSGQGPFFTSIVSVSRVIRDVLDGAGPEVTPGRRGMGAGSASISCVCPYSLVEVVLENRGSPTGPVAALFLDHRYAGVSSSSVLDLLSPLRTSPLHRLLWSLPVGSPVTTGFGVFSGWVYLYPCRYRFPFRGGVPSGGPPYGE